MKGLEHGLKFAVAPKRISTAEIVASVEEEIFHLNDETKKPVSILDSSKSALAEYLCQTNHNIAWNDSKVITINDR